MIGRAGEQHLLDRDRTDVKTIGGPGRRAREREIESSLQHSVGELDRTTLRRAGDETNPRMFTVVARQQAGQVDQRQ